MCFSWRSSTDSASVSGRMCRRSIFELRIIVAETPLVYGVNTILTPSASRKVRPGNWSMSSPRM